MSLFNVCRSPRTLSRPRSGAMSITIAVLAKN